MPPGVSTPGQRLAVAVFLLLALTVQTYFSFALVRQSVAPERLVHGPIGVSQTSPTLAGVSKDVYPDLALEKGDRLIAVDGIPYTGGRTMGEAEAAKNPGDSMVLQAERQGQRLAPVTVALKPIRPLSFRQSLMNIAFGGLLPWFAVLLAAVVLILKPWDRLAWFLGALVISFAYMLSQADFWPFPRVIGMALTAFHVLARSTWPLWLFLFGMYFPDRHPLDRRLPWLKWILVVPLVLLALGAVAQRLAADESWEMAARLKFWDVTEGPAFGISMAAVFAFFGLLGYRRATEKNPDAKRRLRLLMLGASITFTPLFVMVVWVLYLMNRAKEGSFSSDQLWVSILLLATMPVFPLTLGYLVVVHRALDIRVVLRQGLQYALATRGVVVLQVLATLAAISFAVFRTEGASTLQRIEAVAAAVAFVLGVRRGAAWLREWIDRRFFREAYRAEHVLTELSETVRTMVETEPLLETVSKRIAETLHVSRLAVLLAGNGSGFAPAYALGYEAAPASRFDDDSTTVRELVRHSGPLRVYFDDPASWLNRPTGPGEEERRALAGLDAQLLLPLALKDRLLGFISLGPKRSQEPYSGSDLRLLSGVAGQTGLALENSRLASAIAQETATRERLNRELEIARDVQRRFFPQRRPAVRGIEYAGLCRPAQSVGGDFYDFRALDDGGLAIAIGDVAGKGAPAALLMASLQASLRAQALSGGWSTASGPGPDLAERIRRLNGLICEITPASRFSTLFYAHYAPEQRRLRYVNAGHNPPLLVREGRAMSLALCGPAIGLSRQARYEERSVDLAPGDLLVAFTDGVTEAMNAEREDFGEERLTAVLAEAAAQGEEAAEIVERVLAAVDRHAAGAAQHDDITLVVMGVLAV